MEAEIAGQSMTMIKRIAITGPESTGKTTLAMQLASVYNTVFVPEYARAYLDSLNGPYEFDDLLHIAQEQYILEQRMAAQANRYLFCDTDFIVLKIWSLVKFGQCNSWIIEQAKHHIYDLYLLTSIDLPWEPDSQREDPEQREMLFKLYKNELDNIYVNYHIIKGQGESRLNNAIKCITAQFKENQNE